eukprot:1065670_1
MDSCHQLQQLNLTPFEDDGYPCDEDDDANAYPYWMLFINRLLFLYSNHSSHSILRECLLQLLIHLFVHNQWPLNLRYNDHNEMDQLLKLFITNATISDHVDIRTSCIHILSKFIDYDSDHDQRYYVLRNSDLLTTFIPLCDPHTNPIVLRSIAQCMYRMVSTVTTNQYFAQSVATKKDHLGFELVEHVLLILHKLLLIGAVTSNTFLLPVVLLSYCEIFRQFKHYPLRYTPGKLPASISDERLDHFISDVDNCLSSDFIRTFLDGQPKHKKIRIINKARDVLAREVVNERVKIGSLMRSAQDKINVSIYRKILLKTMNDARPQIPEGVYAIVLSYSLDTSPYVMMMHLMDGPLHGTGTTAHAMACICSLMACKEFECKRLFDAGLNEVVTAIVRKLDVVPWEIGYMCWRWMRMSQTSSSREIADICASKLNKKQSFNIWQNISFGYPRDMDNVMFA